MCGIVGHVGKKRCVEGLRNLEYRGYDSAGLALDLPGERIETAMKGGPWPTWRVPSRREMETS